MIDIVTEMRRCYEQFQGQRTLENFDMFESLAENFSVIAEHAAREAMDGRMRSVSVSKASVQPLTTDKEYGKGVNVHYSVDAKYGFLLSDPYTYQAGAMGPMFRSFTDILRKRMEALYGKYAKVYVQHNYGGRKKNFTFLVTVKCYPSMYSREEEAA
jgi:hypothetical protein